MPHVRQWPPGSPRILVADAWLANAGDGAIALATQRRLERLAPGASIVHAAYQGDILADAYPSLALVPPLAGLLAVTPAIPEMGGWNRTAGRLLVGTADLVLSQGGGFAMEHYDPWDRLRAWELAVNMGVPLGFGAQSVGPFSRERERATLARVYGAARVIAVRDTESFRHVIELGAPPERVLVTADEAFSLPAPASAPDHRGGLACALSAHPQARADGSVVAPGPPHALARLVSGLLRLAHGEHVTLVSTQQGLGDLGRSLEDDAELAARVVASMPADDAARVRVVDGYVPPERFTAIARSHRGLVAMRMHAAILALGAGVPTVLLNDSFKVTGMFAMVGLEGVLAGGRDPAAALESATPPSLGAARARAAANDEVVERLLAAAPVALAPDLAG
jgi:polysaccharide pyruvyl transferase WcaK-like protein